MDILKIIKERRSCRKYKDLMPTEEEINKVIEAGLYAASGKNLQGGIIISITNKEIRDKLSIINAKVMDKDVDPFYGAPVVLLVCVKKSKNGIYDGSCMIENMMLEASSIGLGSCWIHRAKEELEMDETKKLLKELNLDFNEYEGIGHVILGYPDEVPSYKQIKDDRVYYIK